jgi:hypothetical protein
VAAWAVSYSWPKISWLRDSCGWQKLRLGTKPLILLDLSLGMSGCRQRRFGFIKLLSDEEITLITSPVASRAAANPGANRAAKGCLA